MPAAALEGSRRHGFSIRIIAPFLKKAGRPANLRAASTGPLNQLFFLNLNDHWSVTTTGAPFTRGVS